MVVQAALADNTTTTGAGVVPTRFLTEVISVLDNSRPFIDSITRDALPDDGMDFKIPRVTQKPSVAEQAAEGDEVSSTAFDARLPDRRRQDVRWRPAHLPPAHRAFRPGVPRPSHHRDGRAVRAADRPVRVHVRPPRRRHVATARTIYGSIVKGIADSYGVMRFSPNTSARPGRPAPARSRWENCSSRSTVTTVRCSRPPSPSNAAGIITPGQHAAAPSRASQLVVDPNLGTSTATRASTPRRSPRSTRLPARRSRSRSRTCRRLEVEVAVYGYVALADKYPTAMRNLTVTP